MRQLRLAGQALVLVALLAGTPALGASQNADTTLARIERLIVAGDRSSARFLADSLVASLAPESPQLPDALYWRAASASSAAEAERYYLRVSIEHSLSRRAPDALLALAQLEFARGDRIATRRRLDRLLRDYPSGKHVVRASLQSGRLAIEAGEPAAGCATLNAARPHVPPDDIELRNQFDYYVAQCSQLPPDTVATPTTAAPAPTTDGTQYSVQVAAFTARVEATALATRLRDRGFDVRIVGSQAPYRVRIGRYPTRADATAALARMRTARVSGIVVEAEPK